MATYVYVCRAFIYVANDILSYGIIDVSINTIRDSDYYLRDIYKYICIIMYIY